MAYKDLTNQEKKNYNVEVTKFFAEIDLLKENVENAEQKTDNYNDVSLDKIVLEDGDGKPATMGHINALAKRLLALEKAAGLLVIDRKDAIEKLQDTLENQGPKIP